MRFQINVRMLKDGKELTGCDLKQFGSINFAKAAIKTFKRAIKVACWPFDADIQIELIDEKGKKNGVSKNRGKRA